MMLHGAPAQGRRRCLKAPWEDRPYEGKADAMPNRRGNGAGSWCVLDILECQWLAKLIVRGRYSIAIVKFV